MTHYNLRTLLSICCGALLLTACADDTQEASADDDTGSADDTMGNQTTVPPTTMPPGDDDDDDDDATGTAGDDDDDDATGTAGDDDDDDATAGDTAGESGTVGDTGDPGDAGFDACNLFEQSACLEEEECLQREVVGFCAEPGCETAADCPAAPPGGEAEVACLEVTGKDIFHCVLDCGGGEECPEGMQCEIGVCAWEFEIVEGCPNDEDVSDDPALIEGTNFAHTDDLMPSCGTDGDPGGVDFTVEYTAPAEGTYTIDTAGSSFDTILHVWDACDKGEELACNDDDKALELQSLVQVDLGEGETIIIAVDGFGGGAGAVVVNVSSR